MAQIHTVRRTLFSIEQRKIIAAKNGSLLQLVLIFVTAELKEISGYFHFHKRKFKSMSGNSVNKGLYYILPKEIHSKIVEAEFQRRNFSAEEAKDIVALCEKASVAGIRTHNAIKAIHLDEHHGSKIGACSPGAKIEKLPTKFKAVQKWNANKKHGIK
jgi:hypothetical protein